MVDCVRGQYNHMNKQLTQPATTMLVSNHFATNDIIYSVVLHKPKDLSHTGKCTFCFAGIYADCRYVISRFAGIKWWRRYQYTADVVRIFILVGFNTINSEPL